MKKDKKSIDILYGYVVIYICKIDMKPNLTKGMIKMLKKIKTKFLLKKYEKLLSKDGVIPNVMDNEIVWILDTNTNKVYYPEISITIVR